MTVSINGSGGLTFNDNSVQSTAASGFGFKNRIINGDMRIDQRNNGASVTQSTSFVYAVDRWATYGTVASKFTAQQASASNPAGFPQALGVTSSSAYSIAAGDIFMLYQGIEGFNISDLAWGTANAATVTLSFWVRSSLTGTFGGVLAGASATRSYPFTYTISAANTWEQKSITIPGPTSGTWLTTNGLGVGVKFGLGVGATFSTTAGSWANGDFYSATGATSVVGTNGATFYITGVQLEKGSTATSFDYRPYGTELALCQRYYQRYVQPALRGVVGTPNTLCQRMGMVLPVVMRSAPVSTMGALPVFDGAATTTVSSIQTDYSTATTVEYDLVIAASLTSNRPAMVYQVGSTALALSSEL